MRATLSLLPLVAACAASGPAPNAPPEPPAALKPAHETKPETPPERLASDTPKSTVAGNTFIAPEGWSLTVRGQATILEPPEARSQIILVDVPAKNADEAVALAWAAASLEAKWPLKVINKSPDRDGWTDIQTYSYQTSPNERRDVAAEVRKSNDVWTVTLYNMEQAVGEKRLAQIELIFGRLLPKGYTRESFAGKTAKKLERAQLDELTKFVEIGQKELKIPGVSVGLIQDGKVVFAGGFGARELGKNARPDADTLYMIASNTKALTTLMLAKLVDDKKLTWDTPATTLLPNFKLGNEDTTRQVQVKHLICACTGLPRQDLEWLFQFRDVSAEKMMATLGTVQPTSKFGEMFQYSNLLASAAGYIGGHVANPKAELGAAYDDAMAKLIFGPLKMSATTFDYARAIRGNHAMPHGPDIDGQPARAEMAINYSAIPVRPAGAAWSNINDMLKYVAMELAEGSLPGGKRFITRDSLLARRKAQVPIGKDAIYGMGLEVDTTYGVPVVHHGGDMIGFHSDMMWLPEHGVGAVVLTNGDPGWILRSLFQRKLLEVLFDGQPEAEKRMVASGKALFEQLEAERKLMTVPADSALVAQLAAHYTSDALGEITVSRQGDATIFDFGEWKTQVGSRKNPDGSVSFLSTSPGVIGFEFVVGQGPERTLVTRDAQHEYTFKETK